MPPSAHRHPFLSHHHNAEPTTPQHNTQFRTQIHTQQPPPTPSPNHATWASHIAIDMHEHKQYTSHIQTPRHTTPKPLLNHQIHNTYPTTSTNPQTNHTQPYKQHSQFPPRQTPSFRNNATKNLCNQFHKIENLSPPPRHTRMNHNIHTLTNLNYQPYLKFKSSEIYLVKITN